VLLAQFSARPWALSSQVALNELTTFVPNPTIKKLLYSLAYGEKQQWIPKGASRPLLVIGWGKKDLVCLPRQANRAMGLFPDAKLHWFAHSGHFPQLDVPLETTRLILEVTDNSYQPKPQRLPENKKVSALLFTTATVLIGLGLIFALHAFKEDKGQ
jgi:hypothetical protein